MGLFCLFFPAFFANPEQRSIHARSASKPRKSGGLRHMQKTETPSSSNWWPKRRRQHAKMMTALIYECPRSHSSQNFSSPKPQQMSSDFLLHLLKATTDNTFICWCRLCSISQGSCDLYESSRERANERVLDKGVVSATSEGKKEQWWNSLFSKDTRVKSRH